MSLCPLRSRVTTVTHRREPRHSRTNYKRCNGEDVEATQRITPIPGPVIHLPQPIAFSGR